MSTAPSTFIGARAHVRADVRADVRDDVRDDGRDDGDATRDGRRARCARARGWTTTAGDVRAVDGATARARGRASERERGWWTNEGERTQASARGGGACDGRGVMDDAWRSRDAGLTTEIDSPAQGVDVSDCFERADLEVKYAAMMARGGRGEAKASDAAGTSKNAAGTSKDAAAGSSGTKTADASPFQNVRRFFDEFVESVKANLSVDAVWSSVRERANRVNAKYGTGDKAKTFLDDARRAVKDADSRIGATKWIKTNAPKAMDQYAKVRSTPVGKFANFMFWIWLFTSGIFWKLFYFGLIATFLVNMLMPSLITDTVENMQKRAQERMGGMGGAGFDPRMGGMGGAGFDPRMGGMGYDPRMSGMGGMGGARGQSAGGRKTYGGGSAGETIDVDAQVSDRD